MKFNKINLYQGSIGYKTILLITFISMPIYGHADTYLGSKLGFGLIKNDCYASSKCSNVNPAGSIILGYRFNPYISSEYSADFLGKYKINTNKLISEKDNISSLTSFTFTPKFNIPLTPKLDVYSRVGGAFIVAGDESDLVPTFSLGTNFKITESVSLLVDYQHYNGFSDDIIQSMDINYFSVGFIYHLGGKESFYNNLNGNEIKHERNNHRSEVADSNIISENVSSLLVHPELTSTIFFDTNKSIPNRAESDLVSSLIKTMKLHPESKVEISGYSDSIGSQSYNLTLAKKRSDSIAKMFTKQGIDSSRIITLSEGEEKPVASNATEQGRAKNRRVELKIPPFKYLL